MVAHQQYLEFRQKFFAGTFPHQRLGQAFENTFKLCGEGHRNCVFFVPTSAEAEQLIYQHHLKPE